MCYYRRNGGGKLLKFLIVHESDKAVVHKISVIADNIDLTLTYELFDLRMRNGVHHLLCAVSSQLGH